jgi:DNA replication and repair protein RecF
MRTAALSLKLAQRKLIFRMTEDQPVLLLDDVMSELDLRRRMNLLQLIDQSQTFITCADEGDLDMKQGNRTYHVFSENGAARIEKVKEGAETELPVLKEPSFD